MQKNTEVKIAKNNIRTIFFDFDVVLGNGYIYKNFLEFKNFINNF